MDGFMILNHRKNGRKADQICGITKGLSKVWTKPVEKWSCYCAHKILVVETERVNGVECAYLIRSVVWWLEIFM